jgi:hypothetical protein
LIAIHLHPPLDREPDYLIDSPRVMKWWAREEVTGNAVLVQYSDLLELIRREPGNEALKLDLIEDEPFTMASLSQTA